MNPQSLEPGDARLRNLLREARPAPPLPPGFQNAVWRRIERVKAAHETTSLAAWFDQCATWILRPRWALATVAVVLLIGTTIGVMDGSGASKQAAQMRYLSAVSPDSFQP